MPHTTHHNERATNSLKNKIDIECSSVKMTDNTSNDGHIKI